MQKIIVIQELGQLILQGNHQPDPTPTIAQYLLGEFSEQLINVIPRGPSLVEFHSTITMQSGYTLLNITI